MPPTAPARRNPTADADADEDAIFVKDGCPVSFYFHASIRNGLDILKQEITRNGGEVCEDEEQADVILVDEEADIEHIRRRFYRSHLLWQQRIFIEPRKFIHRCILTHKYEHIRPSRKGMPGAPPGSMVGRVRVPFTEDDDDHLAYYIATVFPNAADGGRMGNALYRTLTEELALEREYTWARRHTWHSWRERYKTKPQNFDARIATYAAQLKDVSHGFGHDPRSHRYRNGRLIRGARRMEEEEEEESEEGSDRELQREVGGAGAEDLDNQVPGGVQQVHEQGAGNIPDHRTGPAEQQLRRRRRDDPDMSQHEILSGESPQKRQRVADRPATSGSRISLVENARRASGHGRPSRNSKENDRRSPEEGSDDVFAQGALDDRVSFGIDQMPELYEPQVWSPEHDVPEIQPDGPLHTQQTLVNSPINLRSRPAARPHVIAEVVLAAPVSSQATVVAQPLRAARRLPSRGGRAQREVRPADEISTSTADAQLSQQVKHKPTSSRSLGHQPAVAPSDAPYRHTRARSRSVDLPAQSAPPSRGRRVVSAKGKLKENELEEVHEEDVKRNMNEDGDSPVRNEVPLLEQNQTLSGGAQILSHLPETLQEEEDVQNLLAGRSLFSDDEEEASSDKSSDRGHQEFSVNSSSEEPSDSDDAATHRMLQQASVRVEESSEGSDSDEPQEHNSEMASAVSVHRGRSGLPKTTSNKPPAMITRSSTIRVTRQRARAPPFPSPGTKARTVYKTRLRERRGK